MMLYKSCAADARAGRPLNWLASLLAKAIMAKLFSTYTPSSHQLFCGQHCSGQIWEATTLAEPGVAMVTVLAMHAPNKLPFCGWHCSGHTAQGHQFSTGWAWPRWLQGLQYMFEKRCASVCSPWPQLHTSPLSVRTTVCSAPQEICR